jgi:hypothetical protein
VIVAYERRRSLYAQRVDSAGLPRWTQGSPQLCSADYYRGAAGIVSDGADGAVIILYDSRTDTEGTASLVAQHLASGGLYAQRVNAAGVPQWVGNCVAVYRGPCDPIGCAAVADGAGGAIIAWSDGRSGNAYYDMNIYVQRVDRRGRSQWMPAGVALCTARGSQVPLGIVSDGAAGASSRGSMTAIAHAKEPFPVSSPNVSVPPEPPYG